MFPFLGKSDCSSFLDYYQESERRTDVTRKRMITNRAIGILVEPDHVRWPRDSLLQELLYFFLRLYRGTDITGTSDIR